MAGKGFNYYRNSHTHEELWKMLIDDGDPWSVEQAGSVWTTASGGLASAREQLDASMLETVDYWQGPASEEFQRRMRIIYEYSQTAEDEMANATTVAIPDIVQALTDAQGQAREQDLSPFRELDYDDWLDEVKGVKSGDPDYLEKYEQHRSEYDKYISDRHDAMAQIVADLGAKYDRAKDNFRPPASPPVELPGNSTYQPPTGGVFGNDGLNQGPGGTPLGPPGSDQSTGADLNGDGVPDVEQVGLDDLDPVEGWDLGSYDNLDSDISGGLAGGGVAPIGGGGYTGGTVSTGGMGGGTSMAGAGSGLFGPTRGGGAGSAPGRGTGATNSPARSGATRSTTSPSNTRGGSSSGGGRGTGPASNSSGRGMGRGSGTGPRGGTRSGYYDDDDDEETTRETWLKEDDINWGSNRTPDEELDD